MIEVKTGTIAVNFPIHYRMNTRLTQICTINGKFTAMVPVFTSIMIPYDGPSLSGVHYVPKTV
jgi:hypothetical protein